MPRKSRNPSAIRQPGDVVTLKDFRDRPLGSAIYNPHSQIVARRFSRRRQDLDLDFFTRRIRQAMRLPPALRASTKRSAASSGASPTASPA